LLEVVPGRKLKVKLCDKVRALELLMKHFGLLNGSALPSPSRPVFVVPPAS
jgi:hypothetical protein